MASSVIVAKRILVGCAPSSLATEARQHASSWSFAALVPSLRGCPVLIINSNDGYAADSDALGDAIARNGASAIPGNLVRGNAVDSPLSGKPNLQGKRPLVSRLATLAR